MKKWTQVFLCAIGLFLVGFFMPYALNIPIPSGEIIYIQTNDTICFGCGVMPDPLVPMLFTVLLPIVVVIGLLLLYMPKREVDKID